MVFVGVTAAFLVESYREGVVTRRRADQIAAALYRDITKFSEQNTRYVAAIRAGLAEYVTARQAGHRPVPYVLRVPGAEGAPVQVWQTVMQSGAGEVLHPELILELATLYHEIDGETSKYLRYAEFTERRVWPLMAGDTTEFYDSGSGNLKPEFLAHIRQLEEIVTDLEVLNARAHAAATRLAELYPHVAPRPDEGQ